ncbi:MAG: ABC transporter substrate-binding protein [Nocardioidaceae bacterium]
MQLPRLTAALGVAGLVLLAACGGGSDGGGGSGEGFEAGGSAGSIMNENAEAPAPPIEGAQEGGTVNVWGTSGLQSMHPTEAYFTNTTSILSNLVTRSLTQYRWSEERQAMELVPDLATDLGRPNDDFTEWTFTIREAIKWQDGRDVTMEDFVRGIEASFDNHAEGAFPNGAEYSRTYFKGGDWEGPYTDPDGGCDCIEVDGQDITITMARPFPDMAYWASFPAMGPLPEEAEEDPAAYGIMPWSTGPYQFESFDPGTSQLVLVRNEFWDADTDPGRHNYPDRWEFDVDRGDPTLLDRTLLEDQGDAQTALSYDNIQQSSREDAETSGRMVTGPQPCTFFWYMDTRAPEWENVEVRKALGTAWNFDDYRLARGQAVGLTSIPGTMILPPGLPGRVDPPFDVIGNGGEGTGDPDQARQMLEEAGALDTPVTFLFDQSDPTAVDGKNVIAQALEAAGFDPQPRAAANADKEDEMTQDPDAPINLRSLGWCSDWPSGSSWFSPVFSSSGSSNYSYLSVPEIDRKIREIEAMSAAEQAPLWGQLDERIMTDFYPVIVDYYGANAMLHGSKVMGYNNDEVRGMPTFADIWVQQ